MPDQLTTDEPRPSALDEINNDPSSRKRFLSVMGGTGATAALGVLLAACGSDKKSSTTSTGAAGAGAATTGTAAKSSSGGGDVDILNYALTLEYLEAAFYQKVIDSGLVKDKKVADLAKKFGETEQQHVDAIKATVSKLGGTPVTAPNANFDAVLNGGLKKVLETAATVENLGAAAYLGQAGKIESPEVLSAALSIHTVEARHAAALNKLIGAGFKGSGPLNGSIPDGAFAKPMSMDQVLKAVKPFLA